jgi:predicted RecA/RadA family phage recombinase
MAISYAVYVQEGDQIDYTPVADVSAGDVIIQGTLLGIALRDIPAGAQGALAVEGTFDVNKFANEAIGFGATVYFDVGTHTATGTLSYSEGVMGLCVRAALAGDKVVRVKLIPQTV